MSAAVLAGPVPASRARIVAALAVVYVIWGSTYLAIDLAIAAIPPMLLMAARFLLAGGLLYLWAIRRGDRANDRPSARQWLGAVQTGGLLLVGGTGLVALSMEGISSGTAALLAATVPVWMALLGWTVFGDRLSTRAVAGLALGLAGIGVLVDPAGGQVPAMLLAVGGAVAWAAGSMRSRVVAAPTRPLVAASMEMLGASALFLVLGLIRGEHRVLALATIDASALLALGYLVTAGSIVAFATYRWLLLHASTTLVGTHSYVNPVVAVLLGWLVLGDRLTTRMLAAGAVVLASVVLVVTGRPGVPVPAQPTSGADVFAGVGRLRRVRAVGRRVSYVALRVGAVPLARGYRVVRRAGAVRDARRRARPPVETG
jgi:drug/metabolite transporter (DMT)-like permease